MRTSLPHSGGMYSVVHAIEGSEGLTLSRTMETQLLQPDETSELSLGNQTGIPGHSANRLNALNRGLPIKGTHADDRKRAFQSLNCR